MSAPSKLTYNSTIDLLEAQRKELEEETARKKEQVGKLEEVALTVAFEAGQINEATSDTQSYLIKAPFQSPLKHHLQPLRPQSPIKQMQELIDMAKKVQSGVADQALEGAIEQLNMETGKTLSLASNLEEKLSQMDHLINQVKALVEARRGNVQTTKLLSDELK